MNNVFIGTIYYQQKDNTLNKYLLDSQQEFILVFFFFFKFNFKFDRFFMSVSDIPQRMFRIKK